MNTSLQNQITQGITFNFPQAYKFLVIFVKGGIVYGQITEPTTNHKWLTQYTWGMFEQLIGRVILSHR